jgi:hypothetical protein
MTLPRMSTRRWMIVTAVMALDCAGLFCGSDRLMVCCVVLTAAAPILISIVIIAYQLGPDVMGR